MKLAWPTAHRLEVQRISYAGRHCHRIRPLRRTKRSDGQTEAQMEGWFPRLLVESTHANESQCDEACPLNRILQTELLVDASAAARAKPTSTRVSTGDRPARTGADARIEESAANGRSTSCAPTLWKEE